MTTVVDTGGANLASIVCALERLGACADVTLDVGRIGAAERVILPGVGAAGESMRRIAEAGLRERLVTLRQPVLGICLGMQLLFESSEEDDSECLALLPGRVARIEPAPGVRVPHMGWNGVRVAADAGPMWQGIPDGAHFYFVHSYAAPVGPFVRATTDHGASIPAYVATENFHGVQFHPERSADCGARVLRNFLEL